MKKIIDRVDDAIDLEYDTKNEEVEELRKLPAAERVAKGDTIDNLSVYFDPIGDNGGSLVFSRAVVACPGENNSKYREGSPVLLSKGDFQFSLNVELDDGKQMVLLSGWDVYIVPRGMQETTGWTLDPAKVDIRHIVKKTSNRLHGNSRQKAYLSNILEGELLPNFSNSRIRKAERLVDLLPLNTTQKMAFSKAFASENYFLIQGPPGTGKTWLLAYLAKAFADEGKKVLITAFTHTAINNALQKISTLTKHTHVIKVGKSHQKTGLNYDGSTARNTPDFRKSEFDNQSSGIIVGATCYAPCTRKLEFMDWDVVLFDEAAQLSVPLAVSAMARGKQFVFVGDHKQLPPIVPEKQEDPVFSESIFALLHQYAPGIMLDVTYRMNAGINAFPSKQFYEGKLQPEPSIMYRRLKLNGVPSVYPEVLDPNHEEVLVCHREPSTTTRSVFEAEVAVQCAAELIKLGVAPSEIAMITPYRAQVRAIKNECSKQSSPEVDLSAVFVDTVERIQGQERDVVIFSLAVSNPIKANQRAEFFYNPNRMNVALTRPRKKRIVLAHEEIFNPEGADAKIQKLIKVFQVFKEQSTLVSISDQELDEFPV